MSSDKKRIDRNTLQTLVPLNSLTPDNLAKVADKTFVESLAPGAALFKQGDVDNWSFYLLSGELVLSSSNTKTTHSLFGGTGVAKHAVAQQQPRQLSATAKTAVTYIKVDSQLLDLLLTWDQQVAGYEVTELAGSADGDNDWMITLLQTRAFLQLPSANIQTLLAQLQEIPVQAGQVIIKQGDKGDYFYIVKRGRAQVSRKANDAAAATPLAELAAGESFGEEALLSDSPRNADVTMLSDGVLMRLAKTDFVKLMKEPLLAWLNGADAAHKVKAGAGLIDVRLENEYQNGNIKGSHNIPLYLVRMKADSLDRKRPYVVYCDTGRRSAAAAYLLGQRGFEVYVLKGGLTAVQPAKPAGK